jgi:hypothetical protein
MSGHRKDSAKAHVRPGRKSHSQPEVPWHARCVSPHAIRRLRSHTCTSTSQVPFQRRAPSSRAPSSRGPLPAGGDGPSDRPARSPFHHHAAFPSRRIPGRAYQLGHPQGYGEARVQREGTGSLSSGYQCSSESALLLVIGPPAGPLTRPSPRASSSPTLPFVSRRYSLL